MGETAENATTPPHREATTFGFAATVSFIDEQSVRRQLLGQRDRRELSGVEAFIDGNEVASRALNLYPIRRPGNSLLHNGWRLFFAEFGNNSGRDEHTTVENGQDVAILDKNQIPERTGVSDDDH